MSRVRPAADLRSTGGAGEDELGHLLRIICETPAPTFEEHERGRLFAALLAEAGLQPETDELGNVTAELPGGHGPRVLLAAHLDTVFARGVDVRVRVDGDRWRAPGVGDNSASLAVLVRLVRDAGRSAPGAAPLPRLTVAATVGEEGLGDLRGMRGLLGRRGSDFDAVIAVDGNLGTVVDAGVGSKRYVARLTAAGGHSWGDYPAPSATHALGAMIHALEGMEVPRQPRSSYNFGVVRGGTGVNAIAQRAEFNLDLRSVDPGTLDEIERDALARFRRVARRHGVELEVQKVGDRPAASPADRWLAALARAALERSGVQPRLAASSTDANVAMAAGIPAIAFGVYRGGDAHRESEWLERPSLDEGLVALRLLLTALADRWQASNIPAR